MSSGLLYAWKCIRSAAFCMQCCLDSQVFSPKAKNPKVLKFNSQTAQSSVLTPNSGSLKATALARTCHFMFPVFFSLSPSSYFYCCTAGFSSLFKKIKKIPVILDVPWCLFLESVYVYAASFIFSSFLQPFLVAPAFFCADGDFHQREEELCPRSVCHRHSSIFNQKCISEYVCECVIKKRCQTLSVFPAGDLSVYINQRSPPAP